MADTEADNLDDFLDLLENGSDNDEDSPPSIDTGKSSPRKKALDELTYEDLFGSPEKKKRKTDEDDENKSSSGSNERAAGGGKHYGSTAMAQLGSKPVAPSQIKSYSGPSDIAPLVIDHFSRLRMYKNTISLYYEEGTTPETALKVRNFGLEFVNLLALPIWFKTKGTGAAGTKNFWTCAVLARKQPGIRKSAKGNEYAIWELNDLKQLDRSWTLFLFSSAANSSSLAAISVGTIIDLTAPSVMLDSKGGPMKLSINNSSQINPIANSKDFGYCQSKRKDGKNCTAVVNTWECCTCIHHAASELKKMSGNSKGSSGKSKPGKSVSFYGKGAFDKPPPLSKEDGVFTVNFGRPTAAASTPTVQKPAVVKSAIPASIGKGYTRMELQGTSVCNEVKRNALSIGNADSISFKKEESRFLSVLPPPPPTVLKPVDLDPLKTRHLTEKDRAILAVLSSPTKSTSSGGENDKKEKVPCSNGLATKIVTNPTAGSRNFLKFLSGDNDKKDTSRKDPHATHRRKEAEPIALTRETIRSMKKALQFVKQNGPLKKVDPNAVKRKSLPTPNSNDKSKPSSSSSSRSSKSSKKGGIEVEFDFDSDEFKKILNAKSVHEEHLEDVQQEEYFDNLEKKEAIENKMLSTFSIATNAVMCKQCKYIALSQSEYCKGLQHQIRLVKATKRFFKCKDCGNRTMSLDRLPKHPCKQCRSSNWIAAPVGKEKKGPLLDSEVLSVRGHEEKFIGSAGSKMFLNLEVS